MDDETLFLVLIVNFIVILDLTCFNLLRPLMIDLSTMRTLINSFGL